ncbi:MAG: tRNA uridine-5-carboxymethylaminomethyl(34) synthesis GTPase MnmE [Oscillospiraceae bacterium]|nr:tRNA uridine-5-carboxymethylaminomethyl(34) synthesis GTPase MnmE [Oscillospiraceae bacterium]
MSDVIAAVSTAPQPAAIGILRLSGDGAIAAADRVFAAASGRALADTPARKMVLGALRDTHGRVLDQVLASVARGPRSYTGEDTVEFHCHGSPAVLAAGLEALFAAGARQAGPGEFTRRAFLSGRLDLSQAEAVIDLIEAETADAAANAAGQLGGAVSRRIEPVYDDLAGLCAHFHAILDYPDEDIGDLDAARCAAALDGALTRLAALRATFDRGRVLKSGLNAVLLGKPNVGKSSLLNALAGYERVIVTDVAGTTRDAVTEVLRLGGQKLRLTDTAGLRAASDRIEAMGVEKALAAADGADLALCVFDGSRPLDAEDLAVMNAAARAKRALGVLNKADLPAAVRPAELPFEAVVSVSAREGAGLEQLSEAVALLYPQEALTCDGGLLTNARQAAAVDRAGEALSAAQAALTAGVTPDAVLLDVEAALEALGEITGKTMRREITDQIFSRFCVGK